MIPIIYEASETSFANNGLGRLSDSITFQVTEERNGIYEAEFTYPVNGRNYDLLQPGRIVLVTHDDSGDTQPFDIVSYSRPINGIVTFHATHVSYRQTWCTQSLTSIYSLSDAFDVMNNNLLNPFQYVADFNAQGYMGASDSVPRSARQLLGGMEGSILDTYGGEFEWDMWNVNLHKRRGVDRDFSIRYGVNLSEYNEEVDFSSTYTSAVPIWVGQDGTIVKSRVDSGLTPYNGRTQTVVLDLSDRFEETPTTAQLDAMALSMMRSRQTNLPSQNIAIDFVRLQDTAEYADFAGLYQCNLCDTIGVIFPRYGMEGRYKIVKVVWDVLAERYTEMELGTLSTSLSEALGITGDTPIPTVSEDLNVAGNLTVGGAITGTGDVSLLGALSFVNSRNILMEDTGGTPRAVLAMSSSNNTVVGYGGYDASQGGTNVYGNNVRLYSRNPIQFNQPLAGLFKTTTESGTVPATSAHSYSTNLSASMTAPDGYNAVGIVGWQSSNFRLYPFRCEVASNSSITFGVTNSTATATSNSTTMYFQVLWMKATSA